MKITEKLKQISDKTVFSFEIFPPKKEEAFKNVGGMLDDLSKLSPLYISVTCGAGGSANRNKTIELSAKIKNEYGIESMAHMTCISSTPESVREELSAIKSSGIDNILALRGDIPKENFDLSKSCYSYAYELIETIKSSGDMCVAAGAYPEGHIECEDFDESVRHLKVKEEAGADLFVSQLFFDNSHFYRLLDRAEKYNISAPIAPGIMPMMSKSQISNMIFMCGASLPSAMIKLLHKYEDNHDDLLKAGIDYAGKQIRDLADHGINEIHLYTMNKPEVAAQMMSYIK